VLAHANDLRSEIERGWRSVMLPNGDAEPTPAELDAIVHQVVRDWRGVLLQPGVAALLEYAETVTRAPASCAAADIDRLRASGWSDVAIHDAVQVIAYFNYINRVADALGVELEDGLPTWGVAPESAS
jgi:hypothetical protein